VGSCPSGFSVKLSPALRFVGAPKNGAAKKLFPELGERVSGHVEMLSRKIHMPTAKSSAVGVVSVYL
jgi:hypothetical protein